MQPGVTLPRTEPVPPSRVRALRAVLTSLVWAVSCTPLLFGVQRCTVATLFHVPCPGCGMTRALRLLAHGQTAESLRMHPLALPVLVAGSLLMLASVWAAVVTGMPFYLHKVRFGRAALAFAVLAYALATGLWAMRWLGYFGGPVALPGSP